MTHYKELQTHSILQTLSPLQSGDQNVYSWPIYNWEGKVSDADLESLGSHSAHC